MLKKVLVRLLDNLENLEVLNISHCLCVVVQDSTSSITVCRELDQTSFIFHVKFSTHCNGACRVLNYYTEAMRYIEHLQIFQVVQ